MRLAIFTNQFPSRVCTFFARDLRALIDAGVDVEVFAIYPLDSHLWQYVPELLSEEFLPHSKVHFSRYPASGIDHERGDIHLPWREMVKISLASVRYGPLAMFKNWYLFPKAWTWSRQFLGCFDHVLAYWGNYPATCAYLFWKAHEESLPFSIFLHAGTDLYHGRIYLKHKLQVASHIITCSEYNRDFLLSHYEQELPSLNQRIFVHHHGLDFSGLPYSNDERLSNRILAVGRLDPDKGFDILLSAVQLLSQRGINCEVELIGDGKEAGELRRLAIKSGIAEKVIFRGWLPFRDVCVAMKKATLLVHPSTGLGDNIPNVIKEAMALGTTVIASRVAGIPEAVEDGVSGILVPPQDIPTLAAAIENLLHQPELRQVLALNARKKTEEKFDLWNNGVKLASVLFPSTTMTQIG